MNTIYLYESLKDKYKSYLSCFVSIKDKRIEEYVNEAILTEKLWPKALIQFNPNFAKGKKQYDTKQEVEKKYLDILINNLPSLGIAYTDGFRAGAGYAAQIELLANPREIVIPINKKDNIKYKAHYLISVNETLSVSARYTSIMHELGHFFCRHLIPPYGTDWWNVRRLSHADKEFEAESVAWLVCERLNINNPSENYLAGYQAEMIPDNVSIDHIFKAHNEIWKLLFEQQYARISFLYKIDESFKKEVDKLKKKANIPRQPTLFDLIDY